MNTTTARRYNGKCKCGAKFSILAEEVRFIGPEKFIGDRDRELSATDGFNYALYCYGAIYVCRGCRKIRIARPVLGKFRAEKKCDGRCTHATGHDCECACGGKNHGKAYE